MFNLDRRVFIFMLFSINIAHHAKTSRLNSLAFTGKNNAEILSAPGIFHGQYKVINVDLVYASVCFISLISYY